MNNLIEQYNKVTRLTIQDRKRALDATFSTIRGKTAKEPKEKDYRPNTGDWLTTLQSMIPYIVLLAIGCIALYISGGKQLEAAYKVFEPIIQGATSDFIPEDYAANSAVATLLFGEIAAIFFMAMASFLPAAYVQVRQVRFNFYAVMCYLWAVVCASIAIIANISISTDTTQDVSFLATILKVVPPATALFIGMVFERMLVAWQHKSQVWKTHFKTDHDNFVLWNRDPSTHPDFEKILQDNLLKFLYGYAGNRELLESDKQLRDLVYSVELEAMNEKLTRVDVASLLANPTSLSQN